MPQTHRQINMYTTFWSGFSSLYFPTSIPEVCLQMVLLFYHIKETTVTCPLSYGRIAKPLFYKRIHFKLNVSLTEIILC